ncbi:hypothetical protein Trco_003668 [Trichoderma cornu-damae]|uniref:Uncharacterized protein n=1 Tax=Trichoderma cornu-damae TaxID=654480 RepID=A0A9P8QJ76_9HYPO|nr:hypothetical protein Trco_003668 [Trichoderma cornu-damae]
MPHLPSSRGGASGAETAPAEPAIKREPDAEAEAGIQSVPEANFGVEVKPEAQFDVDMEAETKVDAEIKLEAKFDVELKSEANLDVEMKSEANLDVEMKSEAKLDVEIKTESQLDVDMEAETNFHVEIKPEVKPEVKPDAEIKPEIKLEMEIRAGPGPENGLAPSPRPGANGKLRRLRERRKHHIRIQKRRLQQAPGHVLPPSDSLPSEAGVDQDQDQDDYAHQDHDYACYYDYGYDSMPSGDTSTDQIYIKPRYTSECNPGQATPTVYRIKHTWTGAGDPPLASRLRDFFNYMKKCHLSSAPFAHLPLALLSSGEYCASEILNYYKNRSPGCSDIGPAKPRLFSLAFSNPLVMQLVIAHRANHREVSSAVLPTGESAERFYAAAISEFAPKIASYQAGNDEDMLPLTLGSIVLSLVEVARLDKRGQADDYASAAKDILRCLLTLPHAEICQDLPDYLVEHYVHASLFACLATNPANAASTVPFMSGKLREMANDLVACRYQGELCGSWLSIMVCVQDTFELAASVGFQGDGPSAAFDPHHFIIFGRIQARLLRFRTVRAPATYTYKFEAASVFRTAALLYLWSLLESPLVANLKSSSVANTMAALVEDAHKQLQSLPENAPVNAGLCWPLFVIGCFTTHEYLKWSIRHRLGFIATYHKVGNALEALFLLQHVWKLPDGQRTPWKVWKYLLDSQYHGCICRHCLPRI